MIDSKIDAAVSEYLSECDEIVQRISEHFRNIEKGRQTTEIIDSLYRDIHTIKGSSQLFGFKQVGELAHAMESCLDPIRRDHLKIQPELLEVLIKGLDFVEQLIQSIKVGRNDKESSAEINAIIGKLLGRPATPTIDPTDEVKKEEQPPQNNSPENTELSSSIRVPVTLLDRLMNLMGEMVLVRNQVLQYANQTDHFEFLNLSQRLDVVTSEIQGEVMKTRMQPIGSILTKFHRVARDLAKELNKKIELSLVGVETELDKTLLEAVKDPIMHIVRNSCDHGIETFDERRKVGKDITGNIKIQSYHEGGQVIVEISDDGRGLSRDKLIATAIEKGILTAEKASHLSERDAFALIFSPGFSTALSVTNVSGRGVGMDVVKSNIEGIGGLVEIQSVYGQGTTTRLKIPLTLAIVPAMIVRSGKDQFAIPQVKLVELVRVEKDDESQSIEKLQGKSVFRLRGSLLPLVTLREVLRVPEDHGHLDSSVTNIVVLNAEGTLLGLIVDEVLDTAEVVVKPLSSFLKSLLIYSGATVLGDGSVALILDIVGIAQKGNLSTDTTSKAKSTNIEGCIGVPTEEQEFLLFKLNSPTKHAIPLNLVHRLEEFKPEDIEYSGQQRFVRYRESALPIISLNRFLGFEELKNSNSLSVIVTQKASKVFGIEVDEIFDVLKTSAQMDDGFSDRAGIFGNLVTENELIVVVDTLRILDEVTRTLSVGGTSAGIFNASDEKREKGKILFAEDTAFFRRHVAAVLERAGYELMLCQNGFEALQTLEKSKPGDFDLVLTDIEMPKMNGLELAKSIRSNEVWKHIPLVALTTRFSPAHLEEGKAAGFDSYLEKLKADVLLQEMKNQLQKSMLRAA